MSDSNQRRAARGPAGHGPMRGSGEKAKDFKGTFKKLMSYLRSFWFSLMVVFIFAVASTVFSIVGPKILGNATNKLAEGIIAQTVYDKIHEQLPEGIQFPPGAKGADMMERMPQEVLNDLTDSQLQALSEMDMNVRPGIDFAAIGSILLLLLCLYGISALFSYIQGFVITGVSQKISYRFRKEISEKINRMPLRYFDSRTHGVDMHKKKK